MSLSKSYQKLLKERFLLVQSVQTGTLMAAGDLISQEFVEKRGWKDYHFRRTVEFAFLGLCLVGPAVAAWYKLLARQFGQTRNLNTTIKKMASDQLIFAPGFLPIFLTSLGLLHGLNFEQIKLKMKQEYPDIIVTNWQVWPAVQAVNFYLMPLKYQVLLAQSVGVIWNTYLSWRTQRKSV